MRNFIIFIFVLTSLSIAAQQESNFAMPYLNNMQHNPAAVGTNNFDLRAFANFRYQYFTVTKKPYRTISAAVEAKILKSKTNKHYMGIGLDFLNDGSGDGKYNVNQIMVPIAYHLFFDNNNSLALGVSAGMYQRSLNPEAFTWESQWTGIGFNDGIPGELMGGSRNAFNFDLGAGLFYKHQTSITNKVYVGLSAGHLLAQEIGFNVGDKLERRYTAQFGMSHRFDLTNFGISPNIYAMLQGNNMNIIFGSNFEFYLQDRSQRTLFVNPKYISVGIYHRYLEGIIVNFQFVYEGLGIGFAYDSNINKLRTHSKTLGGLEIALSYDLIINKKEKFIY